MGIKNLITIINKFASDAIKYKKIYDYQDMILGIDANLMIYKMIYAIRKNGYDIKNGDIIVTHIHAILQKLIAFKKYNIIPIFVYDGIPPKIKEKTIEQRKVFQKYMQNKYQQAVTQDEKKRYYFMKSDITSKEIDDIKMLIEIFGFTNIDSIEEADSELARLSKDGIIDGIVTDDMDILIFGGNTILKNFTVSDKKKIQEIDLNILLDELNINQKQLIDIGILLGCDYCVTVKGIGPVNSYKYIVKYKSIDNLIKKGLIKLNIDYKKAQKYFINPLVNTNEISIQNGDINENKLKKFLKQFDYNDAYIQNILSRIPK